MPTMNSNDERIAREVLQAVAQITFLMRDQAVTIGRLSSVKETLTAVEFYDSAEGPPILSGYVDAKLKDETAVSWLLDMTWTDKIWTVDSKLASSAGGEQDILQELPTITVQTVGELPQRLVETVRRLLELRPPALK